jgi:hypothetical protein
MKKLFAVLMLIASVGLLAQKPATSSSGGSSNAPSDLMGVGVTAGQGNGINIGYAINRDLQFMGGFGLFIQDGTNYNIDLGARMLFSPISSMVPFVHAKFGIGQVALGNDVNINSTNLMVNVGADWYPTNRFGLTAGVNFVNFDLDNSKVGLGIGRPYITAMFWF